MSPSPVLNHQPPSHHSIIFQIHCTISTGVIHQVDPSWYYVTVINWYMFSTIWCRVRVYFGIFKSDIFLIVRHTNTKSCYLERGI